MSCKIMVSKEAEKTLGRLFKTEKILIMEALDLMESIGQIGEPLCRKLNVWKYRVGNLRIIYTLSSTRIVIVKILKGQKCA